MAYAPTPVPAALKGRHDRRRAWIALPKLARRVVVLRIVFGAVWAIDAYLKWQPSFVRTFASSTAAGGQGQPSWLAPWFDFWRDQVARAPHVFAYAGQQLRRSWRLVSSLDSGAGCSTSQGPSTVSPSGACRRASVHPSRRVPLTLVRRSCTRSCSRLCMPLTSPPTRVLGILTALFSTAFLGGASSGSREDMHWLTCRPAPRRADSSFRSAAFASLVAGFHGAGLGAAIGENLTPPVPDGPQPWLIRIGLRGFTRDRVSASSGRAHGSRRRWCS